jgi:HEAT repeat protein
MNALHDPDPVVRKAAATFRWVPRDESVLPALERALGDPSDEVRRAVAGSLTETLSESLIVVPTLVKALHNDKQRKAVLDALDHHFEKHPEVITGPRSPRFEPTGLRAAVDAAVPALQQALALKNDQITPRTYLLLGRIVSRLAPTRNEDLGKAAELALRTYLQGLNEDNPAIRREVLGRLSIPIPILRSEIVTALLSLLGRSEQSSQERQLALAALAAQSVGAESDAKLREAVKPAVPLLTESLDSPQQEIREAAIQALGYIGSEARPAEETLRRLAENDPQSTIRKVAADAVKAINGIAKMPLPRRRGTGGGMAILRE